MITVIWSPQAINDLAEIRAYIARDSPAWADLTVRRLVKAVEHLEQFPDAGRSVPECQSPVLREVIMGSFRLVYRRQPDKVEIVTVFRGSRNVSSIGELRGFLTGIDTDVPRDED